MYVDIDKFFGLVHTMRQYQKKYFAYRVASNLKAAKEAERLVDIELSKYAEEKQRIINEQQLNLF